MIHSFYQQRFYIKCVSILIIFWSTSLHAQTIVGATTTFWVQADNGPTFGGTPTISGVADGWNNLVNNPNIPNINDLFSSGALGAGTLSNRSVIDGDVTFNYNSVMNLNNAAFGKTGLSNSALLSPNKGAMYVVASKEDLSFNFMYRGSFPPAHRYNTGFRVNYTQFGAASLPNPVPVSGRANVLGLSSKAVVGAASQKNRINGVESSNTSSSAMPVGLTPNAYCAGIGLFPGYTTTGKIAEAFAFNVDLTPTQLDQLDSYLAIKYGVTLPHDYYASNATTVVYSIDPIYRNNIIGIAKDLNFGGSIASNTLFQKQSHNFDDSVRIYKGTLHPTTNRLNTAIFNQDLSYVVMGADLGRLKGISTEMPTGLFNCTLFSRLEREWKVTKTNFGGTELFNWDVKLDATAAPTMVIVSDLRFLVDDDGDFSNGGTQCYYNGDGTGVVISYVNPIITVSNISDTHIPNNGTKYITIASISETTPLPIALSVFQVECHDGYAVLNWQTTSETNNAYFLIERRTDSGDWITVGQIQGNGTSSSQNNYSWSERLEDPQRYYYRLKQIDFNGDFKYSNILVTAQNGCDAFDEVFIYPNPANESIAINVSGFKSNLLKIEIVDVSGRLVYDERLSKQQAAEGIVTKNFAEGLYLVSVKIGNEIFIEKVLINH